MTAAPSAPAPPTTSPKRRVSFVSLGCPKNLVDSEKMLGLLDEAGFALVSDGAPADAVVINTCGFLEASKQESLEVIHDALQRKARGELRRVVVAGCLVQRHRAKLLEWAPGIDALIGVFDRDRIVDAVSGADAAPESIAVGPTNAAPAWIAANALQAARERGLRAVGLTVNGADGRGIGYFEDDGGRRRLTPRHWAYLRVSEGCNQRCAFCTIPSIRGKMRSKPLERIVAEAGRLLAEGAFEINLIGQDTTSYGRDIGYDGEGEGLVGLLRALDAVAGRHAGGLAAGAPPAWMRLMYAYPSTFTDEMMEAIAELPSIVKYIDMPLQHASDRMLKAMRRNTTRAAQEALVHRLRERIPGLALRTTFITGFPGEREEDHQELLEFVEAMQFDMLGVFRYSREEGTPAGAMDMDESLHVPDEVKAEREAEIMLLQQRLAFENAQYVAEQRSQFDVLVDGPTGAGGLEAEAASRLTRLAGTGPAEGDHVLHVGRCYHQAPQVDSVTYVVSRERRSSGELVRCEIVAADGYDLIARPVEEAARRLSLPVVG